MQKNYAESRRLNIAVIIRVMDCIEKETESQGKIVRMKYIHTLRERVRVVFFCI